MSGPEPLTGLASIFARLHRHVDMGDVKDVGGAVSRASLPDALARTGARMRRLVYTSKSLIVADPEELHAILTVSTERNREAGITGMLWSDGANFAQVLEGEPRAVEATMKRICADRRHSHVDIVLDRAVLGRQFGHWEMTLADDSVERITSTSFLVGLAVGEGSASAKRLYDVLTGADYHAE